MNIKSYFKICILLYTFSMYLIKCNLYSSLYTKITYVLNLDIIKSKLLHILLLNIVIIPVSFAV